MKNQQKAIENLLAENNFPKAVSIRALPSSGSDRQYFRVNFDNGFTPSILAAYNPDVQENIAWNSFSTHFNSLGFRVPEILARDETYQLFSFAGPGQYKFVLSCFPGHKRRGDRLLQKSLKRLNPFPGRRNQRIGFGCGISGNNIQPAVRYVGPELFQILFRQTKWHYF